ncbi:dUTP diphosphatase [soil metagenome]
MSGLEIAVKMLAHGKGMALPDFQSAGCSGVDLMAALQAPVFLQPGKIVLIPTGIGVSLPNGYEFQVRPRSGLALRHGIAVLNAPGTIDADYRGEIQVILANFGEIQFEITRGMRIAQMVLARVECFQWRRVEALEESARGAGGFGHTGVDSSSEE